MVFAPQSPAVRRRGYMKQVMVVLVIRKLTVGQNNSRPHIAASRDQAPFE